jgi:hypothetical protein
MVIGIGIVVGLVVVVALALFFLVDRRTPSQLLEQDDGQDPVKRWARGCYSMVFGKDDPAKNAAKGCAGTLRQYWEIESTSQVRETLAELQTLPEGDVAWDLMRVIIVARFAEGAKYIEPNESWSAIAAVRPRLQQAFGSWQELAAAYQKARQAAGFGIEQMTQNRSEAEQIWQLVPYK